MNWLKTNRIMHWRVSLGPVAVRRGGRIQWRKNPMKGHPDIAGVLNGRLFVIEVKAEGGRLDVDQKKWQRDLIAAGALYVLAYSLDDVVYCLKTQRNKTTKTLERAC